MKREERGRVKERSVLHISFLMIAVSVRTTMMARGEK